MNFDMQRSTGFSKIFHEFLRKNNLSSVWNQFPTDFTHIHTNGTSTSTIDHFIISQGLSGLVESCKAVHRGDNISRHSPIVLKVKLCNTFEPETKQSYGNPPSRPLPAWLSANESEIKDYRTLLDEKLNCLSQTVSFGMCKDTQCSDKEHNINCDDFVLDILLAMVETSFLTIPISGGLPSKRRKRRKVVPGWSSQIEQ